MSAEYSIETDLKEAEAMAHSLDAYVRGEQLYGSAGGGFFNPMPSLTVGALAMRLRRLHALGSALNARQQARLEKATRHHDSVQQEWRAHYEEKVTREAHSRLEAMATFFKECRESPSQCPNIYKPEALRRTIVQELLRLLPELNVDTGDLTDKVRRTDGNLRGVVNKSEFIWAPVLMPVYPQDEFWWLYSTPPEE